MKESVRLQTLGFYGTPFPPPLSFNLTAEAIWARTAKKTPTIKNLVRLDAEGGSSPASKYPSDVGSSAILRLGHRRVFTSEDNSAAAWTDVAGTGALLEVDSDSFGNGARTLENADATESLVSHFVSNSVSLPANGGFSVNAFLYEPETTQGAQVWQVSQGRFAFQIRDSKAEAMWRKLTWSQSAEEALWVLWAIEDPDEPTQAAIDAALKALYEVFDSVDLGGDEYFLNNAFSLDFMPEPSAGRVGIEAGNGKRATLKIKRPETERGTPMTLWNEGRLHVRCNGGAYFWQVGRPVFNLSGEALIEITTPITHDQLGPITLIVNQEGGVGTATSVEVRAGDTAYKPLLAIILTGDGASSPVVYGAAVHFEGGERSGSVVQSWDSDDHPLNGKSCILDARPMWDENGRTSWELEIPLFGGGTLNDLPGYNYPYLEDRVANVYVDGEAVLTHGIITQARISDMLSLETNELRREVEGANSVLTLTICDGWTMAEETKLPSPPVGDFLHVGGYGLLLLRACGFLEWQLTEIADNDGRIITGAQQSEDFAQAPAAYSDVAGILRGVEEKYGLGDHFIYGDDGKWRFGHVVTDEEDMIHFTSTASPHNPLVEAESYKILRPFDWSRGGDDSYSVFIVNGAMDLSGKQVSASFYDYRSRHPSNDPTVLNYRGRWRLCPPINDPCLRTQTDCDVALRTLRERYHLPGRTAEFETYFNMGLRPGVRIKVDDRICKITRASGSIFKDMRLCVRELI